MNASGTVTCGQVAWSKHSKCGVFFCSVCVFAVFWLCVSVCAFACLLVAGWWATRWPRDLSRLLNNKRLFRCIVTAWKEQHRDRAREGVLMGGCLGEFRSGHCLLCGRWETHYLSVLYPATPCFSCFLRFAFTSSVAISVFPLCGLHSPLSRSVCCQLMLHFFSPWFLFVSSTHKSLSSSVLFLGVFLWEPLASSSLAVYRLPFNNLSCLISLLPATSTFTIFSFLLVSIMRISILLLLCLISDAVY